MVHLYGWRPFANVSVRVPVLPGAICGLFFVPISKSWASLPLFTSLNVIFPCGTLDFDRANLNSVLGRQVGVESLVEVVDRKRSVDANRVVVHLLDRLIR